MPHDAILDPAKQVTETAGHLTRRPWLATPLRSCPDISIELLPPGSRAGWNDLCTTVERLSPFGLSFASVAYGAGGSTRERTKRTLETLHAAYDVELAGHLTGNATTKGDVHRLLDAYADIPLQRLVALRGDTPQVLEGPAARGYESAERLVRGIRDRDDGPGWDIAVAGHPETHPRAASPQADLDSLKGKVEAGANRIITQFFYDNDVFFDFVDQVRAAGIDVPIAAGVLPIHDYRKVSRLAARCGTRVPTWLRNLFEPIDDPAIEALVAASVAAEQCRELVERGVQHIHLFTMNRANLSEATLRMLGVPAERQQYTTPFGSSRIQGAKEAAAADSEVRSSA